MPIYCYRCKDCGKEFEIRSPITETLVPRCPYCGGRAEKVIQPFSFGFKEPM